MSAATTTATTNPTEATPHTAATKTAASVYIPTSARFSQAEQKPLPFWAEARGDCGHAVKRVEDLYLTENNLTACYWCVTGRS
jgi:hypothetical protein